MSFELTEVFEKDNLDIYLKELAKEYRRLIGSKMPAEIILVGGAAVLANYSFRDMTTDIVGILVEHERKEAQSPWNKLISR